MGVCQAKALTVQTLMFFHAACVAAQVAGLFDGSQKIVHVVASPHTIMIVAFAVKHFGLI